MKDFTDRRWTIETARARRMLRRCARSVPGHASLEPHVWRTVSCPSTLRSTFLGIDQGADQKMNTTLRVAWHGLAVAVLLVAAGPGADAADVAKGRKLAQTFCSGCHEITTGAGWTNAPSFAAIANRPTTTTASLERIIETQHPKMSPGAARSPSEAADLAAYILSLKQ